MRVFFYSTLSGSRIFDASNPWALPTAIKFHTCGVKTNALPAGRRDAGELCASSTGDPGPVIAKLIKPQLRR